MAQELVASSAVPVMASWFRTPGNPHVPASSRPGIVVDVPSGTAKEPCIASICGSSIPYTSVATGECQQHWEFDKGRQQLLSDVVDADASLALRMIGCDP